MTTRKKVLEPFSDAWKSFVVRAARKDPAKRTKEEKAALELARADAESAESVKH